MFAVRARSSFRGEPAHDHVVGELGEMLARQKMCTIDFPAKPAFDDCHVLALTPPRRQTSSHRNDIVELLADEGQRCSGIE